MSKHLIIGSSPRLWGTQGTSCGTIRMPGFIPTPVGNTISSTLNTCAAPVHPHACGEHSLAWARIRAVSWFIPTPVGNTYGRGPGHAAGSVHPHACGEHNRRSFMARARSGSSPRLWGTRVYNAYKAVYGRFIPTPVGNTTHKLVNGC